MSLVSVCDASACGGAYRLASCGGLCLAHCPRARSMRTASHQPCGGLPCFSTTAVVWCCGRGCFRCLRCRGFGRGPSRPARFFPCSLFGVDGSVVCQSRRRVHSFVVSKSSLPWPSYPRVGRGHVVVVCFPRDVTGYPRPDQLRGLRNQRPAERTNTGGHVG